MPAAELCVHIAPCEQKKSALPCSTSAVTYLKINFATLNNVCIFVFHMDGHICKQKTHACMYVHAQLWLVGSVVVVVELGTDEAWR